MSYIQPNQRDLLGILKYPILTEKTIRLLEQNQYSFAVDPKADKTAVITYFSSKHTLGENIL